MATSLNLIDGLLSTLDDDQTIDDYGDDHKQINLNHSSFKNKDFRILLCGMGYPYYSNRLDYLKICGYSNITLLSQSASNKEAQKIFYEQIVTQKIINMTPSLIAG